MKDEDVRERNKEYKSSFAKQILKFAYSADCFSNFFVI